ncbi:MAG TPA: MFS transporter [Rhizomicrobium sp.]|nr:MFS transporter [Rhizomicrobium sp.]
MDIRQKQNDGRVGALIWAMSFAQFGLWMLTITPIILSLPLRISQIDPHHSVADQSMVMGCGAFVMMFSAPFLGALSDFTATPFGRRRPYLIGGFLVGAMASIVMAVSNSLWVIAIAWCVAFSVLESACTVLLACVGDFIPPERRGRAASGIAVATSVASVAGSYIVSWAHLDPVEMFGFPLAASLLVVPWVLFLLPDHCDGSGFRVDIRSAARLAFSRGPQRLQGNFLGILLSRFLVFVGLAVYVIYQAFDITAHINAPVASVPHIVLLGALASAGAVLFGAPLIGYISDRYGRRKDFAILGGLMLACGLLTIALTANPGGFIVGTCLLAAGVGIYNSQTIALSASLMDGENVMGRGMGWMSMIATLPRVVVPLAVPLFLTLNGVDNYSVLFLTAALITAVGAFAILPVKTAR